MRRALMRGLGALLLFGAGAVAGLNLGSQTAPRKLRAAVEESLSEALGTPVSVAGARLLVFPGITVEATEIAAWAGGTGAAFTASRLEAALDPAALLSGRVRFSSIALEGARLALVRGADGRWTPPLLTPGFENPLLVLDRAFEAKLPAPAVDVRSGSLSITDLGAPRTAAGKARFDLDGVSLRLLAPGLLERGRLLAKGILRSTKGAPARFELEAASHRGGLPTVELAASDLALDQLVPYLRERVPGLELAGRAGGVLALAPADGGATDLTLDLAVAGLRAGAGETARSGPRPSVERFGIEGTLRIAANALTLSGTRLRADGLELALSGGVSRPLSGEAGLALEATVPELAAARLRELGAWLPAEPRSAFEAATANLTAGRFDHITLAGNAALESWRGALQPGGPWLPPGVRLGARVDDLSIHPPGGGALTAIRGDVRLEGPDVLTVSGLEGRVGDDSLPILDLHIAGLQHLLGVAPAAVPAVPALLGRPAFEEILLGPPGEEAGPGWSSLEVGADWILHPAFFRPLQGVRVRLEPTRDGVALKLAQASWGGIPVRGRGTLTTTAPERIELSLEVGAARESTSPGAAPESWAHGRFSLETPAKPGLHVASLKGGFDLAGTKLAVFDAVAGLGVPGRLTGDARLDLGRERQVPAEIRLSLDDAEASDLLAVLSDDPAQASGRVDLSARLAGPLRPGAPLLSTLEGDVRITAREGELAIELPMLLAIAKASTTFNPFGSARGIRFDRIDAELRLEGGQIATRQSITLESPDLRLAISGSVDLRERPHRLEAVVGCFFFKPLDQILGAMPVVSRILLGPDKSLFGTFFELAGSWEHPEAGLIPTKTLALGPATFLMEDVPAFVKRGIEAIQSVLPSLGGSAPAVASPAEAADPEGDGS